ncbi:hypothetical protein GCM10029976_009580 [Kribbella albertanoniae]|uniref:S9 family peptidase n=1 Tax=Kribbella albertanoniae TaxID=1266829 RepID=A0A4R4QDU4_9ACTN|nr:alpha/beta fold hydrolase [Kribbella albertanoniae]TDC33657.1 S9 family peptidase [Kribbella albertanoniae]
MISRADFRLSPNGRYGVSLRSEAGTGEHLETWVRSSGGGWRADRDLGPVGHAQMLALDDGRTMVFDSAAADPAVWLFDHSVVSARLTESGSALSGLRLIAGPRTATGTGGLALIHDQGHTEVWRLTDERPALTELLARVPGVLATCHRMDASGQLLIAERSEVATGPTELVLIDLGDGSWSTLLNTGPDSYDSILATSPKNSLVVVGTNVTGVRRIGWKRLDEPGPLAFPEALNLSGEPAEPLACSPDGRQILMHRTVGVRSRLSNFSTDDDRTVEVTTPPGRVHAARWCTDGLTLVLSTPVLPPHPVTVEPTVTSLATINLATGTGPQARIETLEGATGPVEAVVYGGPRWRDCEHVVLAVHGGPLSAWRYGFNPFLARLAEAGIAVVAPNQRGSVGYGRSHAEAIRGAWGGPDLADLLAIANGIPNQLSLLGESYGAYLALLAAGVAPGRWARCAAVAPFLSPQRLYVDAGRGVRDLIDQLDGRTVVTDDLGPRDVLRFAAGIEARLLVAHGQRDPMIPLSQSTELVRTLRASGPEPYFLEVPGGDHDLLADPFGPTAGAVLRFLAGPVDSRANPRGGTRPRKEGVPDDHDRAGTTAECRHPAAEPFARGHAGA